MRHKLSLNAWDLWYSYISATPHTIEVDEFFIVVNGSSCFLDGKNEIACSVVARKHGPTTAQESNEYVNASIQ